MGIKDFFRPNDFVYDEYYNCVICPENQVLKFSTINRDGYREFKSDPKICKNCPSRSVCTRNAKYEKKVTKHIWSEYLEIAEDIRHTTKYKKLYEKRKETIERVFADAKEKYGMRYTLFSGLSHVTNWVRLKFAAMNLKKFAIYKWNRDGKVCFYFVFFGSFRLILLFIKILTPILALDSGLFGQSVHTLIGVLFKYYCNSSLAFVRAAAITASMS